MSGHYLQILSKRLTAVLAPREINHLQNARHITFILTTLSVLQHKEHAPTRRDYSCKPTTPNAVIV
jgi:hypothetical protein